MGLTERELTIILTSLNARRNALASVGDKNGTEETQALIHRFMEVYGRERN